MIHFWDGDLPIRRCGAHGYPQSLMNHNCSYWNGNFRFFLEYAIRIMLQSQTHVVDYTINSNRYIYIYIYILWLSIRHTKQVHCESWCWSLLPGWPARVALPRLLKAGCGACRTGAGVWIVLLNLSLTRVLKFVSNRSCTWSLHVRFLVRTSGLS